MENKKEYENYKVEGYKAGFIGFFVLVIIMFIAAIFVGTTDYPKIVYELVILGGIVVSLIIYLCICIWKDAYNPEKRPSKSILLVYTLWTIVFLINGVLRFSGDEVDVTMACIYLMFGMMFLVTLVNLIAKKIYDKKHEITEGKK